MSNKYKYNFREEWSGLPTSGNKRLPITSAIPYYFRWKIQQGRLLLYDLEKLNDDYNIDTKEMIYQVKQELKYLIKKMISDISYMRNERKIKEGLKDD